jgi:exopolyphosphatase / guanosine-5'-triphosphate,3'-diphosphate pyrophosphatase
MQFAVIDLGTNGFRLNIAESFEQGRFEIIHRQSSELKLASEGIHHIGDAPFQRGLEAMKSFAKTLATFEVQQVRAFGTAALRLADNGHDFIEAVKKETTIAIELISGDREAELIYKGMKLSIPLSKTPVLMVDVGGGSVEFIICNDTEVFWAKSFNVGVTILKQSFHFEDVMSIKEITNVIQFLNESCAELKAQVAVLKPKYPIIACGTLDFLVKILRNEIPTNSAQRGGIDVPVYFDFSKKQYAAFYEQLMSLSQVTLAIMPEVPESKAEMLAVSLVLMDWIMNDLLNAEKLVASSQSMKAGILYEMSLGDYVIE